MRTRGFSIVELLVGIVIITLLSGATAATLRALTKAKGKATAQRQAFARASDVAQRMALDVSNAVRDADMVACMLRLSDTPGLGGVASGLTQADELLVLRRNVAGVRGGARSGGEAEGDEVEAQYRLEGEVMWRRVDAGLDGNPDGGGIATPLAGGIVSVSIEASDGEAWFSAWESDADGLPHAVRIVVTARDERDTARAVARRVVAIDRVPVPADTLVEGEGENSTQSPEGEQSGAGGGT